MPESNTVTLNFAAPSTAEMVKQVIEFAALAGGNPLDKLDTDTLLKELRDRMAKQHMVVQIVPFSTEKVEGEATAEAPRRRGRPARTEPASVTAAEQVIAENVPVAPLAAEVVATATEVVEVLPEATLDEVKRALNEFAAINGQVEARRIMSEQGGSAALKDVPAGKYRAVIHGLQEFKPAALAA